MRECHCQNSALPVIHIALRPALHRCTQRHDATTQACAIIADSIVKRQCECYSYVGLNLLALTYRDWLALFAF